MAIYVDTGAWIALYEPRDGNHEAAEALFERLLHDGKTFVTGWHTLVEFADGLVHHYDQAQVANELARLRSSPRFSILPSESVKASAMEIFRTRTDWEVDLSDCLSFAVMAEHDVETAFAFDDDFEKAGYHVLPA